MKKRVRVLVLDDEPIVCMRLKPALEKLGFEVETFSESAAALAALGEQRFDIVVTDLKMRGPSGMDVLRRAQEVSPATRVVVITGFATVETAKEAMKEGAVEFLAKPFKMSQLRDLLLKLSEEP